MCLRRNAEMRLADCCLTFTACEPFVLQARQQHLRSPRGRHNGLAVAAALQRLLPKGEKHTAAEVKDRQLQARACGWSDVFFERMDYGCRDGLCSSPQILDGARRLVSPHVTPARCTFGYALPSTSQKRRLRGNVSCRASRSKALIEDDCVGHEAAHVAA